MFNFSTGGWQEACYWLGIEMRWRWNDFDGRRNKQHELMYVETADEETNGCASGRGHRRAPNQNSWKYMWYSPILTKWFWNIFQFATLACKVDICVHSCDRIQTVLTWDIYIDQNFSSTLTPGKLQYCTFSLLPYSQAISLFTFFLYRGPFSIVVFVSNVLLAFSVENCTRLSKPANYENVSIARTYTRSVFFDFFSFLDIIFWN